MANGQGTGTELNQGVGVVKQLQKGVGGKNTAVVDDTPPASPGYYYGGGGGGGRSYRRGGGGSGSGDSQPKIQAQINNFGGNSNRRADDLADITQGRADDLGKIANKRRKAMAKNANLQFDNLDQAFGANDASYTESRRNIMQNLQWQPNQQKEQSTLMALRNRMGNSAYGSAIQDLAEGMTRVDDMNDVELINAWKQNENNAYNNWFQANQSLVNDWNDQVASTNEEFSQFDADYADQTSKLRADFADEQSKLFSQYWSSLSNINPQLATEENLEKAARNASGKTATGRAFNKAEKKYEDAKDTSEWVNKMGKDKYTINAIDADTMHSPIASKRAAAKILHDASIDKTNKNNAKKITAAAKAAAKKNLSESKKAYNEAKKKNQVSFGKGSERFYLPNVDLSRELKTTDLEPMDKTLSKRLKFRESADATNPVTANYVRPDAGFTKRGGANGTIDRSTAANQGFTDNLSPFTRSNGRQLSRNGFDKSKPTSSSESKSATRKQLEKMANTLNKTSQAKLNAKKKQHRQYHDDSTRKKKRRNNLSKAR